MAKDHHSIENLDNLNTASALSLFDSLEPVGLEFMLGRWQGGEVPTDHPMDGLLDLSGWYGKVFVSSNEVHPLVFFRSSTSLFAINPKFMPLGLAAHFPRTKLLHTVMILGSPLISTAKPRARLRMVEHRGKMSAAMIYDQLPIIDCFRKLNSEQVLGVMDFKNQPQPYFFYLKRDQRTFKTAF